MRGVQVPSVHIARALEKTTLKCAACDRELAAGAPVCAACRVVHYCDKSCQKTHWKVHKHTCSKPCTDVAGVTASSTSMCPFMVNK